MLIETLYIADDNLIFNTEEECIRHEEHCNKALNIINKLHSRPTTEKFKNGKEFYQHDLQEFLAIRLEFLELCTTISDTMFIQEMYEYTKNNGGIVGAGMIKLTNTLSKILSNTMKGYWYRLRCIDKLGREWSEIWFKTDKTTEQMQEDWRSDKFFNNKTGNI